MFTCVHLTRFPQSFPLLLPARQDQIDSRHDHSGLAVRMFGKMVVTCMKSISRILKDSQGSMQRLGLQNQFFLQSTPWDLIPFLGPDCGSTHDYYIYYIYIYYILYIIYYIYILLYYTIYTCWILLVFHQIQMPCRLDLSVAISLHFPLARARAARSTVYWEWVGVRVGFDKVDRPKTKERRGQSLPQCIPSWVGAIRGSPAPGETSVSHNLCHYLYW